MSEVPVQSIQVSSTANSAIKNLQHKIRRLVKKVATKMKIMDGGLAALIEDEVISADNILPGLPTIYSKPDILISLNNGTKRSYRHRESGQEQATGPLKFNNPISIALKATTEAVQNMGFDKATVATFKRQLLDYDRSYPGHLIPGFQQKYHYAKCMEEGNNGGFRMLCCLETVLHFRVLGELTSIIALGIPEEWMRDIEDRVIDLTWKEVAKDYKDNLYPGE